MGKDANRRRSKKITVRLTEGEYETLYQNYRQSGYPTLQSFVLESTGSAQYTQGDNQILRQINKTLDDYHVQLRGVGTNVNQLAYHANRTGDMPSRMTLLNILSEVRKMQKVVNALWESIRSQMKAQNLRQH